MSLSDALLRPASASEQTEKSGTHSQLEQNERHCKSSEPPAQHRIPPSDSAALVMESMAVPIVAMEKGKSVLFLVGIFRPLICLETKQPHKI